jgi:hypothetical protein
MHLIIILTQCRSVLFLTDRRSRRFFLILNETNFFFRPINNCVLISVIEKPKKAEDPGIKDKDVARREKPLP